MAHASDDFRASDPITRLPPGVADHLGYYVYLYIDPRDNRPFYVGKGKNNRVFAHLDDRNESAKRHRLIAILEAGLVPKVGNPAARFARRRDSSTN